MDIFHSLTLMGDHAPTIIPSGFTPGGHGSQNNLRGVYSQKPRSLHFGESAYIRVRRLLFGEGKAESPDNTTQESFVMHRHSESCGAGDKRVALLSAEHRNAWASALRTAGGRVAATELAPHFRG